MSASPRTFSLKGRALKLTTREDIDPHLAALRESTEFEEVHLSGNTLGIEAARALAELLATLNELKLADLSDIFTGRLISEIPQALTLLCNSLKDSKTLHTINLSDNAFGGRVVEPMIPFLCQSSSLDHLILTNNGLGPEGASVVATAIFANAYHRLRSIVCGRNRCENGSAESWAAAFTSLPHLEEVRMPQNGIRAEGIVAIISGLARCRRLRILDLQDNTFCKRDAPAGTEPPNGTRELARALPSWPNLEFLNVSDCILGRRESVALALALCKGGNKKLATIKMQYDELDARSLNLLAKAISEHLSALTTLELNGNLADPEDECIQNIKDALESHGHADALDELDDMEEPEEEEEDEDEDDGEGNTSVTHSERRAPASIVTHLTVEDATDELADLMKKFSISK